tara:strand:- start:239782 stop:240228 length:447 start_codon:yes stop_codon:yes gene_type:complete
MTSLGMVAVERVDAERRRCAPGESIVTKAIPVLLLLVTFATLCGCGSEPETGSLQEALQKEFGASSVKVLLVTPPKHLEVVLRKQSFATAEQDELVALTREVARFVAARLVADAGIEMIAVELVTQRTDIGPLFTRTAIRGEHPLSSL